jgi:hypothetical protein
MTNISVESIVLGFCKMNNCTPDAVEVHLLILMLKPLSRLWIQVFAFTEMDSDTPGAIKDQIQSPLVWTWKLGEWEGGDKIIKTTGNSRGDWGKLGIVGLKIS